MWIILTSPWGDYEVGKELNPEKNLAMRLISADVARPLGEAETTSLEPAEEQAVQPRPRARRRRRPK
jgi:hypothetical protein